MWAIWLANLVLVLHLAYVSFVVFGLPWIWIGFWRKWPSARSFWFRNLHLTMILIVVFETLYGITCPLTTWENSLRKVGNQPIYDGDCIAIWLHSLLFWEFSPLVFTAGYCLFGIAVALTYVLAPPQSRSRVQAST